MCACVCFVCVIHSGTLEVDMCLVSAAKLYCLSGGKLPLCIENK